MTNSSNLQLRSALYTIISVFFFWGFVAASNNVLIPVVKKHFILSQTASQLIEFAFYIAYFFGAVIYLVWSMLAGDPFNRYGKKNGLVGGLIVSSLGAALFVLAVSLNRYEVFLIGLFFIAFGFSAMQIVANPYVINLGDPAQGSFRLNLAGSINSLGTSIGPVIFGYALFGSTKSEAAKNATIGIDTLTLPFAILSIILAALAIYLYQANLPEPEIEESNEKTLGAFNFPQVIWGMAAIFIYVGVEVTIGSNLSELLKNEQIKGIDETQVAKYVSLYWGSLMIGRWTGAIHAFDLSRNLKNILQIAVPLIAFSVVLFFNFLREGDVSELLIYIPWIAIFILAQFIVKQSPSRTMIIFGTVATIMMLIGLFTDKDIALYSFISGGLFCSVMWPCIFNLSIAGLGKYTNQASSLLVSMILGGAIIPVIQGYICDHYLGIHQSYWITVFCFAFLAFFGWKTSRLLKDQGIHFDASKIDGNSA